MKKRISVWIITMILCFTFCMPTLADEEASEMSSFSYPEETTVYFCSYTTPELAEGYAGSFVLPVPENAGDVSYELVSGDTLEISAEGECSPKPEVWYIGNGYATKDYIEGAESYAIYHEGSNNVHVSWSGGEYTVTVNVARYQSVSFDEYVRNTLNTIIFRRNDRSSEAGSHSEARGGRIQLHGQFFRG